jgi:hypothetical protein
MGEGVAFLESYWTHSEHIEPGIVLNAQWAYRARNRTERTVSISNPESYWTHNEHIETGIVLNAQWAYRDWNRTERTMSISNPESYWTHSEHIEPGIVLNSQWAYRARYHTERTVSTSRLESYWTYSGHEEPVWNVITRGKMMEHLTQDLLQTLRDIPSGDTSVGIATSYALEGQGSIPWKGTIFL